MARTADVLGPFSFLLRDLYRASHEMPAEQFQDGVIRLLKPVLSFDSSMWGDGTASARGAVVHSIHLHEQPPEMIRRWEQVNHEDTAVQDVTEQLGVALRAHIPTYFGAPGKRAIRAFAEGHGVRNALIICGYQADRGLMNWISLFRRDADRQFSIEDKRLLEALWPHLVETVTINRLVNLDRVYSARNPSGPTGLAIADAKGVVYHAEPGFPAVLRAEWPSWRPPQLPKPVVDALTRPRAQFRGARIVLEFRQAAGLFFIKTRRLSTIDALSPRAREIARHFSRGLSHKEIARLLSISPATVRNHLQYVYRRLDISDKAELARLLAGDE